MNDSPSPKTKGWSVSFPFNQPLILCYPRRDENSCSHDVTGGSHRAKSQTTRLRFVPAPACAWSTLKVIVEIDITRYELKSIDMNAQLGFKVHEACMVLSINGTGQGLSGFLSEDRCSRASIYT